MNDLNIKEVQGEIANLMAKHETMARGIGAINGEQSRSKARLAHLEKELPLLQAREFLGEIASEGVMRVRTEIAELKEFLVNAPITILGIQGMQRTVIVAHARALNKLHRLQAATSGEGGTR